MAFIYRAALDAITRQTGLDQPLRLNLLDRPEAA